MTVKLVVVKTFSNSFDANLAHVKLKDCGIASTIHNDGRVLLIPSILSDTSIRLLVRDVDVEAALKVLQEMEALEAN